MADRIQASHRITPECYSGSIIPGRELVTLALDRLFSKIVPEAEKNGFKDENCELEITVAFVKVFPHCENCHHDLRSKTIKGCMDTTDGLCQCPVDHRKK